MISGETGVLALIGHPVGHSLSPGMHNASFEAEGLDFAYVCFDVDPGELPDAVRGMASLKLRGFNITMPHKQAMVGLVDEIDGGARVSGAVNTVVIDEDSRLHGYNTDGGGMVEACREAGIRVSGRRVLLLGAGGAAASIALALGGEGAGELRLVNRSAGRAEELAQGLRAAGVEGTRIYPTEALGEAARDADVIVNATPLGMKDGDPLPIPGEYLREDVDVCDAVYRPGKQTALVRAAREHGARVVAGERMLLYQGVLAQRLWTGREPNVEAMSQAISYGVSRKG